MEWFSKVLYVRAIWYVIVGIIAIFMGLAYFGKAAKNLDDLLKIEGYVDSVKYDDLKAILSNGKMMGLQSCIIFFAQGESAYINYELDKIRDSNVGKGDYCIAWTEISATGDQENYIRALSVNGSSVIEFRRSYWPFILVGIGLLWFIIPIIFVIKRSDILFGNNKDRNVN